MNILKFSSRPSMSRTGQGKKLNNYYYDYKYSEWLLKIVSKILYNDNYNYTIFLNIIKNVKFTNNDS